MQYSHARDLVETVPRLRAMPHVAARIMVAANNDRTSTQQLAEVVALDPAATTQILRWANSAFYGVRVTKVRDLVGAIVTIGFQQAVELAMAASIRDLEGDSADTRRDWKRSMLVATAAARISRTLLVNRGTHETFVAGMLHDIGRNVLRAKRPLLFTEPLSEMELYIRCTDELGFHPGDIGAALVEKWRLPPELALVARYHHDLRVLLDNELEGEGATLLWIVQGAKIIADSVLDNIPAPLRLRTLLDIPQFSPLASQYARSWYEASAHISKTLKASLL